MMNKGKPKRRLKRNIGGKLLVVLQLLLSAALVIKLKSNGMIPAKYMLIIVLALILALSISLGLQYVRNSMNYLGDVISVFVGIVAVIGIMGLSKVNFLMGEVSGAEYKTDNMVVAVRLDDPAENIDELIDSDCLFAIQTALDKKNNTMLVNELENSHDAVLEVKEYASVTEEAEALLNGEVDAAIYNKAFTGIIIDKIADYSDRVRIIYEHGIKTELKMTDDVQSMNVEDPFNIYISGIDVDGPINQTSRSDVNIIMTVNPKTKKILLTSTPRDYYVPIPEISYGMGDKLTHAGMYGVDASIATLEELYSTDITYYGRVNFTSVEKIIDALGGVVVHSDYEFTIGEYTFKEGDNWVTGELALLFVRARECFIDGDNQRGRNQQELIKAVLRKVMSPEILIKANQIIASVADNVETNMPQSEMAKFVNMQLKNGTAWDVETSEVAGYSEQQPCYSLDSSNVYDVTIPDNASVNEAAYKIQKVLEGR